MPAAPTARRPTLRRLAAAGVLAAALLVLGAGAFEGARATNRWVRTDQRENSEGAARLYDCLGRRVLDVVPPGTRAYAGLADGYGQALVERAYRDLRFVSTPEAADVVLSVVESPGSPCGGLRVTATPVR